MTNVIASITMSLDGFIAGTDEGIIHLSPIILEKGVRLFDNLNNRKISIDIEEATASEGVTHLHFNVNKQ